jgi:eukaryotic-like serine/threonine-protein kinase
VPVDVTIRYELGREVGRGGMGTVYRAIDRTTGAHVAIKVLRRKLVRDLMRFGREVTVLSELVHPGIVRYLGQGELPNGKPALVMEWVEGQTLSQRLQTTGVTLAEAVTVIRCVADALAAAHAQGIVHRDIKPDNVLLMDSGFDRVKLIDFGIARRVGDVINLTRTGMRIGTPCYMSPEQARGEREVTARADVFMLGCVLYECATGKRAFTGVNAQALLSKIILVDLVPLDINCREAPPALVSIVTRMMSKDPTQRFGDAVEVAAALAALGPIPAGPRRILTELDTPTHSSSTGLVTDLQRPPIQRERGNSTFLMLMVPPESDDDLDADEDTIEDTAHDNLVRALQAQVSERGLRVEVLANGSVLGILSSSEPPEQIATRLAECALSVKRWAPEVSVAFLSDSSIDDEETLAHTLERGFANLETAALRALDLVQHGGGNVIHLDAATAKLLGDRFEIVHERDEYRLVAAAG